MMKRAPLWRAALAGACLFVSAIPLALGQTSSFTLAEALASDRGRLNDNPSPEPGREERFVDARGWAHILVPTGTTIDEQTPTSADLRWREGAHEVACALQFRDFAGGGLDFVELQGLAAGSHSPNLESGVIPPGVTVRERRMLTLGPEKTGGAAPPRAAAWRFDSPAGLAMGMAYVEGIHGVMQLLCFRQDGGDPLATIATRWRIARAFAE